MDLFVIGNVRDWNHQANEMDIWRGAPSGGVPERLTYLNTSLTFVTLLDQDTLAFVAPDTARGRIVALVSRRRQPADIRPVVGSKSSRSPAGSDGSQSIYVGVGEPQRWASGRHESQPCGELVACADSRRQESR